MDIKEKLQQFIDYQSEYVERDGHTTFSTCSHPNSDRIIWRFRGDIEGALRKRGYKVTSSVNHGVTDYVITKEIHLQ